MLCPICGQECAENSAFCDNCGNPLHRAAPVTPAQTQQAPTQSTPQPAGELPCKTMSIVAMILGILSILGGCCLAFVSIPSAIVGIILSSISMKRAKEVGRTNNYSLAGLICSIIGLVLALLFVVFVILVAILEANA